MKQAKKHKTIVVKDLRWRCDIKSVESELLNKFDIQPDVIGQKRGVDALRIGFDIESEGYNIFVNGLSGTGRKTAIKHLLKETKRILRIPDDKMYVHNFKNPDMPVLIRLKAGEGRKFKKEMNGMIDFIQGTLPALFERKEFKDKKKEISAGYKESQNKIISDFEKKIRKENFALIQMQVGAMIQPGILPTYEDKPVNFNQLTQLVKEGKLAEKDLEKIKQRHGELNEKMKVIFKKLREIEKKEEVELKNLDDEFVTPIIELRIKEINENYENEKINLYLDEVKESILESFKQFVRQGDENLLKMPVEKIDNDPFLEYRVNLLVDNSGMKKAPVVFETSPTYSNLFGTVEVTPTKGGYSKTDFTKIKAGSILKADGGFLIIEALDLLIEPGVWPQLKRTLKNRKLEIQIYTPVHMISVSGMKPEAIKCNLKVAIVGNPYIYSLLFNQDQEFRKIFKIRADFDSVMKVSNTTITDYNIFINRLIRKEKLFPLTSKAITSIVEYGARLAGSKDKLSTQFNHIADILREADYWTGKSKKKKISEEFVDKAIESREKRSGIVEEKIQEMIEDGTIMIDTTGAKIGQVNGLSVYNMGDYTFGKPARITANVSLGDRGIINIEREAQLSGKIHNKGVLIITGFLRSLFAQDKPLAINASLCFEQSYSGVEGDSASSTEIYALLSALSAIPLKQSIAVTGSVNQKGKIQAIGGVNEKVEGFYKVCKALELKGEQGVMIPRQNVKDLMLKNEVIKAVKEGKFHIYAVDTIQAGMEILTGIKAGGFSAGKFEPDTLFYRVNEKLQYYADQWKKYHR